jgi:hypothetical protein
MLSVILEMDIIHGILWDNITLLYIYYIMRKSIQYWFYYIIFKLFEIFLFIFPAFPPTFITRICVLIIYAIGHIYAVQTCYKNYKSDMLAFYLSNY